LDKGIPAPKCNIKGCTRPVRTMKQVSGCCTVPESSPRQIACSEVAGTIIVVHEFVRLRVEPRRS
jgi:hypothetical protein